VFGALPVECSIEDADAMAVENTSAANLDSVLDEVRSCHLRQPNNVKRLLLVSLAIFQIGMHRVTALRNIEVKLALAVPRYLNGTSATRKVCGRRERNNPSSECRKARKLFSCLLYQTW